MGRDVHEQASPGFGIGEAPLRPCPWHPGNRDPLRFRPLRCDSASAGRHVVAAHSPADHSPSASVGGSPLASCRLERRRCTPSRSRRCPGRSDDRSPRAHRTADSRTPEEKTQPRPRGLRPRAGARTLLDNKPARRCVYEAQEVATPVKPGLRPCTGTAQRTRTDRRAQSSRQDQRPEPTRSDEREEQEPRRTAEIRNKDQTKPESASRGQIPADSGDRRHHPHQGAAGPGRRTVPELLAGAWPGLAFGRASS